MLIKRLGQSREIAAGDHTWLRELLHPDRDSVRVRYSLAIARLEPGASSRPHRLRSTEVYYVIRGTGEMHVADGVEQVSAGDAIYIPAGAVQWLKNIGPVPFEFACIVDPAWQAKDEEVL
jgi:mannose-6-phosphate isomerase-like protein (cupin superfamily)